MILLSVSNIKKVYGEKVIFDDIAFSIDSNEKIGIIGVNGTGKSSLLKIMAGLEVPDQGEVITSNELVIEYLPQNPYFDEKSTVLEQVFKGTSPIMKVLREYERVAQQLEKDLMNEKLQKELMDLSGQMDAQGAWQLESEAKAILTQLGINDFEQKVANLSGGQRKKIALAGALIRPCNLLILDEPTNHLDNDTIDYLENMLKTKKCALAMVTHDRYFLERVTNRIIELDQGKVYRYEGNYEAFLEKKMLREQIEERQREKDASLYKQELEWMHKGVEARRTKQKARQERFYELEERMGGNNKQTMEIALGTSRLGKKIIELKDVSKTFDGKCVIKEFTYTVVRGDRIGIVGNNGMGKSTLLNLIAEKFTPDTGSVAIGDTVKIGYYTQESKDMNMKLRVIDYIKEKAEQVKLADGTMVSAGKMLEKFLFPPILQYSPIEKLSGGEKRRLYLLSVLMEDINVLLLDEPTNDLDIYTLQILEDFIDNFNGPVIAVSHDRYFLDRIADKIFAYEGEGQIVYTPGNYSDYHARKMQEAEVMEVKKEKVATSKKEKVNMAGPKLKFTFKEQKEYEQIDSVIEALEEKIQSLEADMVTNSTHFAKLQELTEEKEKVEEELMFQMERWEYLNELAERIKNQ
ncbi:ABC-F family ATP-binding cassette domain-containing protein [Cellulosilyticum ruminicola]|uniref:ABC-F family ATP-binding cassette domain-containing protein n=1 Tax=Cellulosilyticum ruminicola TaxID=425254 RepID=UPI0006D195BD|nr:ABC-F family ATP-binding cassette domain-containing protein [Cellulosilyticum ruminicola]